MQGLATCFRGVLRRTRWIVFAASSCFVCATAAADALEWQVDITPGGELFPVIDLSQAPPGASLAVGGGSGLVVVRVTGNARREVHLRIDTAGLRSTAIVDAAMDGSGTALELRPRLEWDRSYLRTLTAPRAQTLHVTLEASGQPTQTRDIAVRLHPLDDALYYVREGRERVDLSWIFAAYVDPHDRVVDEILAMAGDAGVGVDRHAAGAIDRLDQARAVWDALEARGLRYDAGDPALSRGPSIYSQRVRLLAESWEQRRANCIDSSVLIASALERLGIASFIVLVPRHAFVGFYSGDDQSSAEFLETTLLGMPAGDRRAPRAGRSASQNVGFDAARRAGHARWKRIAAKFDGTHRPDYELIDIPSARANGTLPIGRNTAAITPAADADSTGSTAAKPDRPVRRSP